MEWEQVRQQIEDDDREKWDLTVPASVVRVEPNGLLRIQNNGTAKLLGLSDNAISQLCQRLAIPVKYFKRLPPEMQSGLANFDLERIRDSHFLLRAKNSTVRAVLSDRYVTYNNRAVIETVVTAIQTERLSVKNFVLEDEIMFIKLVSADVADEVLQLRIGVMISNSEVGAGQVKVEPFLFRKPCTNDLIVAEEVAFRHSHVHISVEEFTYQIAAGVKSGMQLAQRAVTSAWTAAETRVPEPVAEINRLGGEMRLSKKLLDSVHAAFREEPSSTRWGVVNSFTRAAQRLSPVARIEVERLAGRLLAA